jgi:hypothetical protein
MTVCSFVCVHTLMHCVCQLDLCSTLYTVQVHCLRLALTVAATEN